MADFKAHIDTFPLEHLFQRLQLAGFRLSPGDRLRALQVLGGPGKTCLEQPQRLKELLAPVLVRSEAEQLKFYEIFDQYYQEVTAPLEITPIAPADNSWWRWLLIIPLIAGLWYAYYALTQQRPSQDKLSVYIDGPGFGSAGDTVLLKNLSRYRGDSSELSWRWSYVNLASQQEELFDTSNFNWQFIVPRLDSGSYLREIRLAVHHPEEDTIYQARLPFTVLCANTPAVTGIEGTAQLEADQEATFRALGDSTLFVIGDNQIPEQGSSGTENWRFAWDFGDGKKEEGAHSITHTYAQNGQYRVQLTVTDTSAQGFCVVTHSLDVKVGRDQAFLPLYDLQSDKLAVLATWGWGFYVLLAVLGLSLFYYWLRWLLRRRKPSTPEEEQAEQDKALYARFAHSDKAPYFIPLRDQGSFIQYTSVQLRLADALRLRQEGLRKEIDVTNTLQATIDSGGFPEVRFRYATQPSEYLCLIDEQSRASHLGELFKYLAQNLREQDVHLEVYYYRKHLSHFWNTYFPKGRTLDQLQRAYPNHRLIVCGDLHELIDPHAQGQPRLRMGTAAILRQWPLRLLLTPVAPVSWSYREKLLARVFNVFVADTAGLASAALHIENEEELLSDGAAFDRWHNRQRDQRQDVDTEHRNWRRWRFIKEYLNAYDEDLTRWFKALAVFPIPSWEMTIAIGKALGVEVSYDNLLRLSRIPVLQNDRFDERLRRELIKELDPKDERVARQAVQAELTAVKTISAGSHAHRDLETALAVQDFALAPFEEDHRKTLRFLLRSNLLTPAQEADLDRVASHSAESSEQQMTKAATKATSNLSIRDWLEEDIDYELDAPDKKPDENKKDLRRALVLTAAYVILLLLGWQLGATDFLYQLAFAEPPAQRSERPDKELRHYILVKETAVIDSAVIYNNLGVHQAQIGENRDTLAATYFDQALGIANNLIHGNSDQFQGKTINYALANANLARLYFNAAAWELNAYLQDSLGQAILPNALRLLEKAYISDSVALDVWHARGVIHYYAGSPEDSSLYYYDLLDSLDYFQNLEYTPNLETLLGRERSRIIAIDVADVGDQALDVEVLYYLDPSVNRNAEITLEAIGQGEQPIAQTKAATPGEGRLQFRLEPPRRKTGELQSLGVQLRRQQATQVIDDKKEVYRHRWQKPREQIREQQTVPVRKNEFQFKGTVLADNTQKPVDAKAVVTFMAYDSVTYEEKIMKVTMEFYGEYFFELNFGDRKKFDFELLVEADGYSLYMENFSFGNEIFETQPMTLDPILLKPATPRPRMSRISAGSFEMGNGEKGSPEDERPVHEVVLSNYNIGTYEVTFEEYDLFCERTGRAKPDDQGWGRGRRPVIDISWFDAVSYCNWLSEQHGYSPVYNINLKLTTATIAYTRGGMPNGYRLPTEAEWEYAARGGVMMDKSQVYAGGARMNTVGWYELNSKDQTHPVGQLQANNAGTYDMSGNVWEWCYDWFGGYSSSLQRSPMGPDTGSHRIIRGGAWIQAAEDCQVTTRQFRRPEEKTVYIGFRLARN